jgi:ADP-heptose:LPS heptosyltransferase
MTYRKEFSPKTILISRTDSIGDVVLTLPLASALRKQYPKSSILFLGSAYTRDVVACCNDVDGFVDWSDIRKMDQESQINFLSSLHVGVILHVFPDKEIASLAKKAKIPFRLGTSHRVFHWFYCNHLVNLSRKSSPLHEAQLNLLLCDSLLHHGLCSFEELNSLMHFHADQSKAKDINLIDPLKYNLVIQAKSKGSAREWGLDNFVELIKLLPSNQFKIFISGTKAEGNMVRQALIEPFGDKVTDLTGRFSLAELITFLSHCDGIVAASTGPLHLSAALGIHAIGLYPPIKPMHPGRWRPIGNNVRVFVSEKDCDSCRKQLSCACMRSISPTDVASYLIEIAQKKQLACK